MNHYAIESADLSMKGSLIQSILKAHSPEKLLEFNTKKGLLFSNIYLHELIRREYEHEHMTLSSLAGRNVLSLSSGEQKKLLFTYILSQNPDFIILDNPFDCLDTESVQNLQEQLHSLSDKIQFIQIFKRRADLLTFISHIIKLEKGSVKTIEPVAEYMNSAADISINDDVKIPPSPVSFDVMPEVLIDMQDVEVSYFGKCIVRDINWQIKRGEFWQLVGPNGSGKTTLLSMIYGNNSKAYGQNIHIFGRRKGSGESVWEIKSKIGYFTPSLTDLFSRNNTVLQMVISGLYDSVGLYKKPTFLAEKTAKEWLKVIGLFTEKNVSFQQISQVKQRMVLLARAMIKHPPLLILDEPSTGLNDTNAALLSGLINKIAKETDTAILYVSHRKEPGLSPQSVLELQTSDKGSRGIVK